MRKKRPASFKTKAALEAIKEEKAINEIASEYGIHPPAGEELEERVFRLEKMRLAFEKDRETLELQKKLERAYKKIGQLKVKKDFLPGLLKRF